jgi:hypothetical protein
MQIACVTDAFPQEIALPRTTVSTCFGRKQVSTCCLGRLIGQNLYMYIVKGTKLSVDMHVMLPYRVEALTTTGLLLPATTPLLLLLLTHALTHRLAPAPRPLTPPRSEPALLA